jgi:hypothetical protein
MPQYGLLAEENRRKRRTIADALEVLRTKANFEQNDVAKVWLGELRLPSKMSVTLVCVSFDSKTHEKTFLVSLPTASSFRASLEGAPKSQEFEIDRLEGAMIDGRGHVRLSNGDQIRAVEIIPALLPYDITPLDWAIVRQTIAILGIEEQCRYDPGGRLPEVEFNPFDYAIDCSKLSGHRPPLRKTIQARIEDDKKTGFGTVSLQKIADTLRKFGMRIPANRPSSRSGLARAKN